MRRPAGALKRQQNTSLMRAGSRPLECRWLVADSGDGCCSLECAGDGVQRLPKIDGHAHCRTS
jgi:hypothetical protein